jgi:hypothetical protein
MMRTSMTRTTPARWLARAASYYRWGLTPDELRLYRLQDQPASAQAEYVSALHLRQLVNPQLNAAAWRPLVKNKWMLAHYFRSLGVPIPEPLGVLHPGFGFATKGSRLRVEADLAALLSAAGTPVVVKPIAGTRGRDVFVVRPGDDGRVACVDADGRDVPFTTVLTAAGRTTGGVEGMLVEEWCEKDPWYRRLNAGAGVSIRVITLVGSDGEVEVQAARLALAVGGNLVSNSHRGSLSVWIDTDSGRLGGGYLDDVSGFRQMSVHPDTGERVEGAQVPDWDAIVDVATQAASAVPWLRSVGWDILPSTRGPIVLEGNEKWFAESLQAHGGFRRTGVADRWEAAGALVPDDSLQTRVRVLRVLLRRAAYACQRALRSLRP